MAPDQAQFERDLGHASFIEGVVRQRWRVVSKAWPSVVFAIKARDESELGFRLDFSGYPQASPTARLWSWERDQTPKPEEWPKGSPNFLSIFNPGWKNGSALYHPFDRISREGHGDWSKQYPHFVWNAAGTFVQYLAEIHRILNGRGYHGKQ